MALATYSGKDKTFEFGDKIVPFFCGDTITTVAATLLRGFVEGNQDPQNLYNLIVYEVVTNHNEVFEKMVEYGKTREYQEWLDTCPRQEVKKLFNDIVEIIEA